MQYAIMLSHEVYISIEMIYTYDVRATQRES